MSGMRPALAVARLEGTVGALVRVVVTAVYINLVWLLLCLPVVTAPAASIGLLRVVGTWARTGQSPTARGLLRCARTRFAPATLLGCLALGVGLFLVADLYAIGRMGADRRIWLVVWLAVTSIVAVLVVFVPVALADTRTGVRAALSPGVRVTCAHPGRAVVGAACVTATATATVVFPVLALVTGVVTAAIVDRLWRGAKAGHGDTSGSNIQEDP